ncbi:class I SAM-dependent methyltransferase [Saccharopolyspora sp. NFXS83]|uniref:class I SAM-dependent methyltransferase n=1 Tax=Saccharopolyspora sp. NFXS83 TaxID=2993560 RepID=UPI00224B82D7|nr:class I SAM-dependent methyltransferase [Saccharopolyspora sp. NFXS83]MCX2731905.1 class I SAM-dependent methyltransferase [Saccharopolyspora sp. NFXS83]
MQFDSTGKVTLDHIYTRPDPRDYFRTLRTLDYRIPQLAKPYFGKFLDEYRQARQVAVPTVVDIGSSYGINAALLKCDAALDELYAHYTDPAADSLGHEEMLARDRDWLRARGGGRDARFIGLDTSRPALDYALDAGFLDDVVHADLEAREPDEQQRRRLATADVVVSTGCLGYVGERTVRRIADAAGPRKPWMAHFVLRMFPFTEVAASLAELGYETVHVDGAFEQRRFASPQERALMLDTLAGAGVSPDGLESEGWLYAELFLSRPPE